MLSSSLHMAEKNNIYEVRYNKKNFIEITKYVN